MKKIEMNTIFKQIIILIMAGGFLFSCSSENTKKEAEKLLEKQAQVLESQQESVEELFADMEQVKDSLEKRQQNMQNRKTVIEKKIDEFEQEQAEFTEAVKKDKQEELEQRKQQMLNELQTLEDSMSSLTNELGSLDEKKSTIAIREKQVEDQKAQVKKNLITGIDKIDKRLDELESQSLVKQKEYELNSQKIELANKKIDLLEDEKNIYLREKNKLLQTDYEQIDLENYNLKINEIAGSIEEEKNKIENAQRANNTISQWKQNVNKLQRKLKAMMEEEYSKSETIEAFTREETARLMKEDSSVSNEIEQLEAIQAALKDKKASINENLKSIDENIELVKGQELSEILAAKSGQEEEEADLMKKEQELILDAGEDIEEDTDTATGEEFDMLVELENKIRQKRKDIELLKAENARAQEELSEQKAKIEQKRSERVKAATTTIVVVVILGVLAVVVLYFVGRRKLRKRKSTK